MAMCKGTRAKQYFWRELPGPEEHMPRVQFYGIGSLNLASTRYRLIRYQFSILNPGEQVPNLRTFVKREAVRDDSWYVVSSPATRGKPIMMQSCPDVQLYTIESYIRGQREAEISQWD